MSCRRSACDPLASRDQPRCLATYTMHLAVIDSREILAGADFRAVLRDAQTSMLADGWQPECDGRYGFFFARRGSERVEVVLQHVPPGAPGYGPSNLGACPPDTAWRFAAAFR